METNRKNETAFKGILLLSRQLKQQDLRYLVIDQRRTEIHSKK